MITKTIPQLLSFLENLPRGAKIVGVITLTKPKMTVKSRKTKEANPYGVVEHLAHRTIILGANYENLVNKQRQLEGHDEEFVAERLWNGLGIKHGPYTVQHSVNGKIYFAYKPMTNNDTNLPVVHRDEYRGDGVVLNEEAVKDLKENYFSLPKKNDGQEVDKEIFWRTLDLSNLITFHYGGVQYHIEH